MYILNNVTNLLIVSVSYMKTSVFPKKTYGGDVVINMQCVVNVVATSMTMKSWTSSYVIHVQEGVVMLYVPD